MTIQEYIEIVSKRLQSGISREHSYRGDFESLMRSLLTDIEITNEPANVTNCGNPDFVLTKKQIPIGYIEAKDVGKDLNSKTYSGQFDRYKKALDNLIITDYLWFKFYQHGKLVHEIKIAELENGIVKPIADNFKQFENLIIDFTSYISQTIKSSKKLAIMMAAKARLLQDILERAITSDEESQENTSLQGQYKTFKRILIHDLSPKGFADIYAQTLAYGMFAARLHDTTLDNFSRQEAAELIPKSNPFLRKLFGYVAGPDIDERIKTTVDNLADVFRATDVKALLHNFGTSTQANDPMIHFYETFLAEYDPKLRKAKGVWYTPEPVVKFMVRAVDDILKTEFDLPQGLVDTSKIKIKVDGDSYDGRTLTKFKQIEKEVHRVQILDPATGTGTFLAEIIKYIYNNKFKNMQGAWSGYVEEHLIPRLNGFELLMASYAMAHLKLDMLLTETGYKPTRKQRLNVYLTNSLEEHHPDTGTLFAEWLSAEANEANHIKRDTPVMVVIGNPPYSSSSSNKGAWITQLTSSYKKNIDEINKNALSDDYVKFIRYGHFLVENNGEGILAYITNNSFLGGITHRQMRKDLLKSFDVIYVVNLHGDTKSGEFDLKAGKDENVFDIQQGVSITILVKNRLSRKNTILKYVDWFGVRNVKYTHLLRENLKTIEWQQIIPDDKYCFFLPKDFTQGTTYNKFIPLDLLFDKVGGGIKFRKDNLLVKYHFNRLSVMNMLNDINSLANEQILRKYNFKETKDWTLDVKKQYFRKDDELNIRRVSYRPFDDRFTYYPLESINKIITRGDSRKSFMANIGNDNLVLIATKKNRQLSQGYFFISKNIFDLHLLDSAGDSLQSFPLYTYIQHNNEISVNSRQVNLNSEIVQLVASRLKLNYSEESENVPHTFGPVDIFDYIYGVVHSEKYRNKYKEYLKIEYPRVPYPKDKATFWQLVKLGGKIRKIHLLESPKVEEFITTYPNDGDNKITTTIGKKNWELFDTKKHLGRIWINDKQYFDNIPLVAWEFYIGGYQPAQKWLKDRKQRTLSFEDIMHYQKIIVALFETDRLMKEIDKIEIE